MCESCVNHFKIPTMTARASIQRRWSGQLCKVADFVDSFRVQASCEACGGMDGFWHRIDRMSCSKILKYSKDQWYSMLLDQGKHPLRNHKTKNEDGDCRSAMWSHGQTNLTSTWCKQSKRMQELNKTGLSTLDISLWALTGFAIRTCSCEKSFPSRERSSSLPLKQPSNFWECRNMLLLHSFEHFNHWSMLKYHHFRSLKVSCDDGSRWWRKALEQRRELM